MTSADFSQFVVTARLLLFEASPARPPQLWTHSFRFIPAWFNVGSSDSYRAFASFAALPLPSSLIPSSCSSGQPFAASFLQIPLTMDTLAFGCNLLTIRAVWGLAPVRVRSCWANKEKRPTQDDRPLPLFHSGPYSGACFTNQDIGPIRTISPEEL